MALIAAARERPASTMLERRAAALVNEAEFLEQMLAETAERVRHDSQRVKQLREEATQLRNGVELLRSQGL